jgi:hypothetical protein
MREDGKYVAINQDQSRSAVINQDDQSRLTVINQDQEIET